VNEQSIAVVHLSPLILPGRQAEGRWTPTPMSLSPRRPMVIPSPLPSRRATSARPHSPCQTRSAASGQDPLRVDSAIRPLRSCLRARRQRTLTLRRTYPWSAPSPTISIGSGAFARPPIEPSREVLGAPPWPASAREMLRRSPAARVGGAPPWPEV
jgi:hypothetical protein